jgi:hypothetical protein
VPTKKAWGSASHILANRMALTWCVAALLVCKPKMATAASSARLAPCYIRRSGRNGRATELAACSGLVGYLDWNADTGVTVESPARGEATMGSVAQNVIRQDFGFPWIVRTDTELRKLGHEVQGGFNRRQRRVRGSRIEDARSAKRARTTKPHPRT